MWCDDFDADLLKVVPGALEALGDSASQHLLTYSSLTGGKINCPASWNGAGALFWTDPGDPPPASFSTRKQVAGCTFAEAVRDEWVHSAAIVVNGHIVWQPPVRAMEALMYDLRCWSMLGDGHREAVRQSVRDSLAAAGARLLEILERHRA
jgi:hypothetical protein